MTVTDVLDLKDGDRCLILVSACCGSDMTGVEHGDHKACRYCRKADRTWLRYVAPFRSALLIERDGEWIDVGGGPDPTMKRQMTRTEAADREGSGLFWWG